MKEDRRFEYFTREEIQEIGERAYRLASVPNITIGDYLDPAARRVLIRLGDSCNEIDAYLARTQLQNLEKGKKK